MNAIASAVSQAADEQAGNAEAAYIALARDAAAGTTVAPKRALAVLAAAGKTSADFAQLVEVIASRIRDAEAVVAGANAEAERVKLQADLDKTEADFRPLQNAYDDATRRIGFELKRANQLVSAAADANGRLFQSCPYPGLRKRNAEIGREVERQVATLKDLKSDLDRVRGEISHRAVTLHNTARADLSVLRVQGEQKAYAERLETQIAIVQARVDELAAEAAEIAVEMRKP